MTAFILYSHKCLSSLVLLTQSSAFVSWPIATKRLYPAQRVNGKCFNLSLVHSAVHGMLAIVTDWLFPDSLPHNTVVAHVLLFPRKPHIDTSLAT